MENSGLVIWDVDGTLIPADLRWLRRAIARTYQLAEGHVVFPSNRVHGYTDESITIDAAVCSGIAPGVAEAEIRRFHDVLSAVMIEGRAELAREQPAYPGAAESMEALGSAGFVQTVLTGNLRFAAETKLRTAGLHNNIDLSIGGFGSDARDRFLLPDIVARRYNDRYGVELDSRRTVIIGDTANDIACARHAGFHVVVVAHRVSRDELSRYEPDAILDNLSPDRVVATVSSLTG